MRNRLALIVNAALILLADLSVRDAQLDGFDEGEHCADGWSFYL